MASSTIIPITKAKANKVRVSKLNPAIAITIKVPNKEIGIAIAVIKVAFQFFKKTKIVAIANKIAQPKASTVA